MLNFNKKPGDTLTSDEINALGGAVDKQEPIVLKFKIGADGNIVVPNNPLDIGLPNKPFIAVDIEPFDIATIKQAQIDNTPVVFDMSHLFQANDHSLRCIESRITDNQAYLIFQGDMIFHIGEWVVMNEEDPTTHEMLYQAQFYIAQSRMWNVGETIDVDGQPIPGLMSVADKTLLDSLPKKITDETTARTDADMAIRADIQGIKDKGSLHDLFLASGATYNDKTKMYQLNGLDLTFEETLECWEATNFMRLAPNWNYLFSHRNYRTNFPLRSFARWILSTNLQSAFESCTKLEVLDLYCNDWKHPLDCSGLNVTFLACKNLRIIKGIDAARAIDLTNTFKLCSALTTVELQNLKNNVSFNDSPLLSKESIIYIISHAKPSSAITITLHPTVYAMASKDADVQTELTKQPNISLAEGTPNV